MAEPVASPTPVTMQRGLVIAISLHRFRFALVLTT
jgi:hypothetical protein